VRVVACTVLLALCLGVAGCRLFGKKSAAPTNPADRSGQPAADLMRPEPSPAASAAGGATPAGVDGLLAGRVLDSYGSKPPLTSIRVVALDEGKDAPAAPIEYRTDDQGYFTIFALQPGKHYKLVARAKDGDRLLAGISYVTPPDPKVLIHISEDFASSTTPPPPPEPSWPGAQPPAGADGAKPAPKRPAADLGVPKANTGASTPTPTIPPDPSHIVGGPSELARNGSPPVEVPGPKSEPTVRPQPPLLPTSRVPSCSVTADGGLTFVLNDLDGRPWEFPARPHGRVILLDFWGTWCGYCVRAIPDLIQLQQQYGSWGLDVIGVAYEQDGTPEEQGRRIKAFRDRRGINYHLLLGGGMDSCPFKQHFGVSSYPTLILLDEKGHVLQRYDQGLTAAARRDLEYKIRWYLNVGH
jgi:thiol-disulfide isomerase/thioredoxin